MKTLILIISLGLFETIFSQTFPKEIPLSNSDTNIF